MSVLTYLQNRASEAVLSATEENSISTSIGALKSRLDLHFGVNLREHFRFGSSTRGTILPRAMDEHSDIDYLVVFKENGYTPQTYLDRLKRFVEYYYSTSEIKQSSPTIVLQLNHIKFELVPALLEPWGSYKIPNGPTAWKNTNPNDFNQTLLDKNKTEVYLMKPTIRLAKFWNAKAGYVYDSFLFEKWIVSQNYLFSTNQKDYLFSVFDKIIISYDLVQWQKEKIERAKQIVTDVRKYEKGMMPYTAEIEVKKLIPE